MPETVEQAAARKALARAGERRRKAITALRIGEAMCESAAAQLGNGLGPVEARRAAVEAAAELASVAAALRRLALLRPAERRALAVQLSALGVSRRQVAGWVGVSERTVVDYLHQAAAVTSPAGSRGSGSPARKRTRSRRR